MNNVEFTVDSYKDTTFRTTKISPVSLLAISTQINFDKFEQTEELIKFSLEHLEVKIGEQWFPVKVKDKDVYMPTDIESNLLVLNDLVTWFLVNIISRAFQKSNE